MLFTVIMVEKIKTLIIRLIFIVRICGLDYTYAKHEFDLATWSNLRHLNSVQNISYYRNSTRIAYATYGTQFSAFHDLFLFIYSANTYLPLLKFLLSNHINACNPKLIACAPCRCALLCPSLQFKSMAYGERYRARLRHLTIHELFFWLNFFLDNTWL